MLGGRFRLHSGWVRNGALIGIGNEHVAFDMLASPTALATSLSTESEAWVVKVHRGPACLAGEFLGATDDRIHNRCE